MVEFSLRDDAADLNRRPSGYEPAKRNDQLLRWFSHATDATFAVNVRYQFDAVIAAEREHAVHQ